MGFRLTVKGQDTIYLDENIISSASVDINTPYDSMGKSAKVAASMLVTGKLLSTETGSNNSDTVKLLEWALVPATSTDSYRDVTVEVIAAGETFRTIKFPNAFIIDFRESYNNTAGVGQFSMALRQRADHLDKIKPISAQPSEE